MKESSNSVRLTLAAMMSILMIMLTACATDFNSTGSGVGDVSTFRRAYANSHLVKLADEKFLMIDSGGYEQAPDLESDLKKHGINPSAILAIVLTHGHWDHAAGAKYFQDKYGTPVVAGKGDEAILSRGHAEKLCPTSLFAKWRVESDSQVQFVAPKVTHWIEKPTDLNGVLGVEGMVVPVPSHTPGSLAIILGKKAFVGDLFRGGIFGAGPELHFYICDVEGNKEQIRNFLIHEAKDVESFFPGHFGPSFSYSEVKKVFFP